MADVYDRLLQHWKKQGIEPAAHQATPQEIAMWEEKYHVRLPNDLREYFMRVNGFLQADTLEFDDQMMSLLPLSAMVPEEEWSATPRHENRFVFADYLIQSSWWCVKLLPDATETTEFYLGGGAHAKDDRLVASSVEQFLELYLANSDELHFKAPKSETDDSDGKGRLWIGSISALLVGIAAVSFLFAANHHRTVDNSSFLRFEIESSPNNLDLRQGTDAQSERIGALIYDSLVRRDEHFQMQPWLATAWERPDATTWVFHLRPGVVFHDGHAFSSADVAYTLRSLTDGSVITSKGSAFQNVDRIETPDAWTLRLHTRVPDASLLFNLSDGLFGVVEQGATKDEGLHPVGTGAFRFVSQTQDKDVVLEANARYWGGPPKISRVRFEVVPDDITMALELKKGSADVESNAITLDMVHALADVPGLRTESGPSSTVIYAQFNVTDPVLRDVRVRQAIAYAIDRQPLIDAIWRGQARVADSLLPPGHWARAEDSQLAQYPHDVAKAEALLDAAGFRPDKDGVRLRFTLKTSTDETTRLLAQAVQQQLAAAGIAMSIRSAEFGTFYADIVKGAFQMYILRWTGASNLDPDIFRYAYAITSFPPKGANRGHYVNARVDALLTEAAESADEALRRRDYVEVQQILARDVPSLPLWYPNNEIVHRPRITGVTTDAGGSFAFLRTAQLQ